MSRHMTGSNSIPLGGGTRPGAGGGIGSKSDQGGSGGMSLLTPAYLKSAAGNEEDRKRPIDDGAREGRSESREERRKKRKSRWESESDKIVIPGMPTTIPSDLTKEQEEGYLLQLKIEEISRRLRTGELGIPDNPEDRSPSPEPIYSHDGKRLNTREYRTRKQLEEKRHESIQRMLEINPEFKPPADYKAFQTRVSDKVMIPQDHNPSINFIGLIIGPRGNTLKSLEKDTGAKIIIRGKGSVKEGKVGSKTGQPLPGEDEPLHAYVTATDPACVKKAINKIKQIIQEGLDMPEGSNELRKAQLRELALLNGTLREDGVPVRCTNCGADNHRSWQCQDKPNVTNTIRCTSCGGTGHIAQDCRHKNFPRQSQPSNNIDKEYMSLMAELGEGPPPDQANQSPQGGSGPPPSLFGRDQGPPLAIRGPPPQSRGYGGPPPSGGGGGWNGPGGSGGGGGGPPNRPPWGGNRNSNNWGGGHQGNNSNQWGGGGNNDQPPSNRFGGPNNWQNKQQHGPPHSSGGNNWQSQGNNNSWQNNSRPPNHQGGGGPPPGNFQRPPPGGDRPPHSGGGWSGGGPNNRNSGGGPMMHQQQNQHQPPWRQGGPPPPPGPVPPPNNRGPPPSGYWGAPPPPPPQGGGGGGGYWPNQHQGGNNPLSGILQGAPPPPPPPPS